MQEKVKINYIIISDYVQFLNKFKAICLFKVFSGKNGALIEKCIIELNDEMSIEEDQNLIRQYQNDHSIYMDLYTKINFKCESEKDFNNWKFITVKPQPLTEVDIWYFINNYVFDLFNPENKDVRSSCTFTVINSNTNEQILRADFNIDEKCSVDEGQKKIREHIINNTALVDENTQLNFIKGGYNDFDNALTPTIKVKFTIDKLKCEVYVNYWCKKTSIGEFKIKETFSSELEAVYREDFRNELIAFVREKLNIPDKWEIYAEYYAPDINEF